MSDTCKDRTGLYIMVFLILMNSCAINSRVETIEKKLDSSCICEVAGGDDAE